MEATILYGLYRRRGLLFNFEDKTSMVGLNLFLTSLNDWMAMTRLFTVASLFDFLDLFTFIS